MVQDDPLQSLIRAISRLPGLGQRSARRIALHLLENREQLMRPLAESLQHAADNVHECQTCFNLDTVNPCRICRSADRDQKAICVVAHVSDVWAIERTGQFKGTYHVLGGVLSALEGVVQEDLNLAELLARIERDDIAEIILALNPTVDGQTTSHVIAAMLEGRGLKITRLAHGVPVGGELDYLDDGTIALAFSARTSV